MDLIRVGQQQSKLEIVQSIHFLIETQSDLGNMTEDFSLLDYFQKLLVKILCSELEAKSNV